MSFKLVLIIILALAFLPACEVSCNMNSADSSMPQHVALGHYKRVQAWQYLADSRRSCGYLARDIIGKNIEVFSDFDVLPDTIRVNSLGPVAMYSVAAHAYVFDQPTRNVALTIDLANMGSAHEAVVSHIEVHPACE